MQQSKKTKIIVILAASFLLFIIAGILFFTQPWQKERMVLSTKIPAKNITVELWELPHWNILMTVYTTWLVLRLDNNQREWYMIDAEYVRFHHVVILLSNDGRYLRVENSGFEDKDVTCMIAEYDFKTKSFFDNPFPNKAEYIETVRGLVGWQVLAEKYVR